MIGSVEDICSQHPFVLIGESTALKIVLCASIATYSAPQTATLSNQERPPSRIHCPSLSFRALASSCTSRRPSSMSSRAINASSKTSTSYPLACSLSHSAYESSVKADFETMMIVGMAHLLLPCLLHHFPHNSCQALIPVPEDTCFRYHPLQLGLIS